MNCRGKVPHLLRQLKAGVDRVDQECLPEALLVLIHESIKTWEPGKPVPFEKEIKKYFEMLDDEKKADVLANTYRMNRKYYDEISSILGFSIDRSKIHR